MLTSFFDPATAPFAIALCLMLMITLLEVAGALLGMAPSDLLDSMLPDVDVGADIELDADADISGATSGSNLDADPAIAPDAPGPGPLSQVLGWLCIGRVPVLVLLIVFLTGFGFTGFAVQMLMQGVAGIPMPAALAAIPALTVAFPVTRMSGLALARIMPKEETEAVSLKSFIGRIAVITRGEARAGMPAEAKLTDAHGLSHYILVEPDIESEIFPAGEAVLLVRRHSSRYRVIANPNPHLTDHD